MLQPNMLVSALAALIPMVLGMVWYNEKVFGKAWMAGAKMTQEDAKGANMILIFGLSYVFCFFVSVTMHFVTIHQYGLQSLFIPEMGVSIPGSEDRLKELMGIYGGSFRTFHHGVIHGVIIGLLFVLPVTGMNALFERKSWKYILINAGFWTVSLALIGGVVCRYSN